MDTKRKHISYALPMSISKIIPIFTSLSGVGLINSQLFASPLRVEKDGSVGPYLAKRWHYSDNFLRLTLELHPHAVFHDGHPITSKDVAFSIMMVKKHHPFRIVLDNLERVETPDSHTAVLVMSKPIPALLQFLVPPLVPIIPQHIYDGGQPLKKELASRDPVGSGPFMLDSFVLGKTIKLKNLLIFYSMDTRYWKPQQ